LIWAGLAGLVLALFLAAGAFLGGYNIAADAPHTRPVAWVLQTVRDHSIAARAEGIVAPADLDSRGRIVAGAALAFVGKKRKGRTNKCPAFLSLEKRGEG